MKYSYRTKKAGKNHGRFLSILGLSLLAVVTIALLANMPRILVRAYVLTLRADSIHQDNQWNVSAVSDLFEKDTFYAKTNEPNKDLVFNIQDPKRCDTQILTVTAHALAYTSDHKDSIALAISGSISGDKEETSHDTANLSHHSLTSTTLASGEPWTCKALNDLVIKIRSYQGLDTENSASSAEEPVSGPNSEDTPTHEWRVDKVWVDVEFKDGNPEINQRSYRWQYSTSQTDELLPPDTSATHINPGELIFLRVMLDNTGTGDSINDTYSLQYASSGTSQCSEMSQGQWIDVGPDTPISYAQSSTDPITTSETNTDSQCGLQNCEGFVEGTWASERTLITIPAGYFTEVGFTLDTVNAQAGYSYCVRVVSVEKENSEPQQLSGHYLLFPKISMHQLDQPDTNKELKPQKEPKLRSSKSNYHYSETPRFELEYLALSDLVDSYFSQPVTRKRVFSKEPLTITATLRENDDTLSEIIPSITIFPDGTAFVEATPPESFRPGKYTLNITISEKNDSSSEPPTEYNLEQDFTWGVLAINTNKATFTQGDSVSFLMTVLDDGGFTNCNAAVDLTVSDPNGKTRSFSTSDQTIKISQDCAPNNVTYTPDYFASLAKVNYPGTYAMTMTVTTSSGTRSITDSFSVEQSPAFDVERKGPIRILPTEEYTMTLSITPASDFSGMVSEIVPDSFIIKGNGFISSNKGTYKQLSWTVDWQASETYELSYTFDAPDDTPEFYLLGPLTIGSTFTESRRWHVASDAPGDLILLWDTTVGGSIPGDWSSISSSGGAYYQKFIRGAETAGGTGGYTNHTHTVTTTVSTWNPAEKKGTGSADLSPAHSHGYNTGGLSGSNEPEYRTLTVIRYSGMPSTIPNYSIALFESDPGGDWTRLSGQDGSYIRGDSTGGTTGGNSNNQHYHTITQTLDPDASSGQKRGSSVGTTGALIGHTHTVSNQDTNTAECEPVYREVMLYYNSSGSGISIPDGMIALFDSAAPSGWTSVSGSSGAFENKFIKPASSYGGSGGGGGHSHNDIGAFPTGYASLTASNATAGAGVNACGDHQHTVSYTGFSSITEANNDPPYVNTVIGKKNPANVAPNDPSDLAQKQTDDTVIAIADWTDETSVKFTATASDPDNPDTLYLCIEADQLGTAFSDTEDSCGSGVAYSGSPVTVTHTLSSLIQGTEYHWQARIKDNAGAYSSWVSFSSNTEDERDFGIDNTAPGTGNVYDGSTIIGTDVDENNGSLTIVEANWANITDAQSGIKAYEYAIGSTQGGTDILTWTSKTEPGNLFSNGFESADLSAWDSNSNDGGDLKAHEDAPYLALYGAAATIDDGNSIYVQDNFTSTGTYYARLYLNPNNLTMAGGDTFTIMDIRSSTTIRASVELYYSGSNYQVRGVLETGPQQTSWVTIGATSWTSIELMWFADASGYVSLWVDGTRYDTATGNTSSTTVDNVQLGMVSDRDAGTSGTFYFDQFTSDNAGYNGPFTYFIETISTAGHLHTGQDYYSTVRATNNAESTGSATNSDGFVVLPTFSFTVDDYSITFLNLNEGNSWTDTQANVLTASTNAYGGYITTGWISQALTNTLNPSYTIANYASPNSAPTVWTGTGFGYTTNDDNLSGGTADRFTNGGPKYAGFLTSGSGDPVADHTAAITGQTGAVSNEQFTITYRITADATHAAGPYSTNIIFIATPQF